MSWSQRSQYLYVNDQAPVGLQYNQTTGIWETIFLDENQNKFASLADIFNNPVAPLPIPTSGTDLTLSGFLSAGTRVQAGTHFRAPNDPTATTPVYGFTGATDKGMYPTANGLGFAVGGTRIGEVQSWGGGFTGNVIQVVQSTNTYKQTATSTSYTDLLSAVGTTWEVSITPKYSNSRIYAIYSVQGELYLGSTTQYFAIGISKKIGAGAYSRIFDPGNQQFGIAIGNSSSVYTTNQWTYIHNDLSNTTSEIKYKLECKLYNGSGSFYINMLSTTQTSTFTLLEIQQ